MNFCRHYLNNEYLKRSPHKWILGLICYPLHMGAKRYHRVYHLRYRHAKKLFLFDLTLLLSIFLLLFGTLYWFFYMPSVRTAILSSITLSPGKVRSGETLSLTLSYENISEEMISPAIAMITLPENFIADENPSVRELTIPIGDVPPDGQGTISISGRFLHTPGRHTRFVSQIKYTQTGKHRLSSAVGIITARGSILETKLEIPQTVESGRDTPITIILTNTGDEAMPPITLPRTVGAGDLQLHDTADYTIPTLLPGSVRTIHGSIVIRVAPSVLETNVTLTPSFEIENVLIPQSSVSANNIGVIHPRLDVHGSYPDKPNRISAGDVLETKLTVINTGDTPLTDIVLHLPLSSEVFDLRALAISHSVTEDELLVPISPKLIPGERAEITIYLPVRSRLTGEIRTLDMTAIVQGTINEEENWGTLAETNLPTLTIDVPLRTEARAFYYTAEGDQLGRGPLPPRVGEETRYWMSVTADIGSDPLSSLDITIALAPGVTWTGRSSVNRGSAPTYHATDHTITYRTTQVGADSYTGIFLELATTPTIADRDTHLPLVESVRVRGSRTTTDLPSIEETIGMITTALTGDNRAIERGTRVEE